MSLYAYLSLIILSIPAFFALRFIFFLIVGLIAPLNFSLEKYMYQKLKENNIPINFIFLMEPSLKEIAFNLATSANNTYLLHKRIGLNPLDSKIVLGALFADHAVNQMLSYLTRGVDESSSQSIVPEGYQDPVEALKKYGITHDFYIQYVKGISNPNANQSHSK